VETLNKNLATATFAGGCFWCTEAIFNRLRGVASVMPGYSGGNVENPTYDQVCQGNTGHAEAIQINFDPKVASYEKLLAVFFKLHDPTTLNQQGNDIGTQYRSAVFYHDQNQKEAAEKIIQKMNKDVYEGKIVTELSHFEKFYPAENYHQDYYAKNSSAPYCRIIIDPKITKLYKEFKEITKEN